MSKMLPYFKLSPKAIGQLKPGFSAE